MIIDKGLSIAETDNLLQMSAAYIDFLKLTFGTAALYDPGILREKITLAAGYGVAVYPGGTFFEIALWRKNLTPYFRQLRELGFQWVEISDGTIEIPMEQRKQSIHLASQEGLQVITEVGKKDPLSQPEITEMVDAALWDLEEGAKWVIIEARESGHGIGIYDQQGGIIATKLNDLRAAIPLEHIIWEAPLKGQQARLINEFGPNVNLGNIPPGEALALEALRLGYRSDTWNVDSVH